MFKVLSLEQAQTTHTSTMNNFPKYNLHMTIHYTKGTVCLRLLTTYCPLDLLQVCLLCGFFGGYIGISARENAGGEKLRWKENAGGREKIGSRETDWPCASTSSQTLVQTSKSYFTSSKVPEPKWPLSKSVFRRIIFSGLDWKIFRGIHVAELRHIFQRHPMRNSEVIYWRKWKACWDNSKVL